jgi:EAL and modified HD-GYP domain-containing signal transduction protein
MTLKIGMTIALDPRQTISVARQPILDRSGRIFGHELLYRQGPDATSCTASGDLAGARTLNAAMLAVGLDALTGGLPAFINLTRHLLLNGAGTLLPREVAVLEIREDVPIDEEVMGACRALHGDGYALALDDFSPGSAAEALLPWVRYVKVDVLETPASEWRALAARLSARHIRLVAEKVETAETAGVAAGAGFHLFQGYYFCRPVMFAARPVPSRRLAYVRLLAALNRPNLSLGEVEDLVKHDVSLSYRVLRSINSAAFALQREVTSIRSALVLLGVAQIRKWASVWALAGLSGGESPGAVAVSLVRARCCERLGGLLGGPDQDGYFLLGLCSLLDVILQRPMTMALDELPLPASLRDALLGKANQARVALDTIVAYEQGHWDQAVALTTSLGLDPQVLEDVYGDALRWSRELSQLSAA